ncbi:MAG: alpha/beta fold hydrolase [Candidatus Helarchaeota archaeon]|nr:alpha/beta fold hydrolase [Candidatus Helarchaeota archaeon]
MSAKILVPAVILSTILFWILALVFPTQAALFLILRNISFGIFLFYGGLLLGMLVMLFTEYEGIEYKSLQREKFELTLKDGILIHGEILTGNTKDSSPVVLICHGHLGRMESIYLIAYPLVLQGYKVVCYNLRGHGKKPFKSGGVSFEIDKTSMDVQQIIDFIVSRPDLNHEKLAAVGFSLGGYILLTGGYIDPRIKLIIAFCTGHDWLEMTQFWKWYIRLFYKLMRLPIHPSEEFSRKISPKYFLEKKIENKIVCLAHAKNDRLVPYKAFLKNKELLGLPDEQTIEFDRGDHGFFGQTTVYLSQIIKWLNDYL